jgi:hypothetical protein
MSDSPPPAPTDLDRANAATRQGIADRQNSEYAHVLRLALGTFGPGWLPRGRHFLLDKDEEDRSRRTGRKTIPSATVYTVRHEETGAKRHFTVSEDGQVTEVADYQEAFGTMLFEPHPMAGFEHQGQWRRIHRYSLCWAPIETYHPHTAEGLAKLRESRERKKAEREAAKERAENPLFTAWAERLKEEEERQR